MLWCDGDPLHVQATMNQRADRCWNNNSIRCSRIHIHCCYRWFIGFTFFFFFSSYILSNIDSSISMALRQFPSRTLSEHTRKKKKMRASIYWMQCTWLGLPKHSKQSTKHVIKYCCVVLLAQRMGENWPEQNSNNMKITKLIVWRVFHEWSIISYHRTQNFWCVLCVLFFFGLPHLRIRALCVQMNEMNGK